MFIVQNSQDPSFFADNHLFSQTLSNVQLSNVSFKLLITIKNLSEWWSSLNRISFEQTQMFFHNVISQSQTTHGQHTNHEVLIQVKLCYVRTLSSQALNLNSWSYHYIDSFITIFDNWVFQKIFGSIYQVYNIFTFGLFSNWLCKKIFIDKFLKSHNIKWYLAVCLVNAIIFFYPKKSIVSLKRGLIFYSDGFTNTYLNKKTCMTKIR